VAYMPKPQSVKTVALRNDPPFIFVSYTPAILLGVDGEPVLSEISKTDLKFEQFRLPRCPMPSFLKSATARSLQK
jgi:hypothetical protein